MNQNKENQNNLKKIQELARPFFYKMVVQIKLT